MKYRLAISAVFMLLGLNATLSRAAPLTMGAKLDGEKLYRQHCAQRHSAEKATRAPRLEVLRLMGPQDVLDALELGTMKFTGFKRTVDERTAIAEYVALSDIGVKIKNDPEAGMVSELDGSVGGGLFAYEIGTGKKEWSALPPGCGGRQKCSPAQSAAVMLIPGVVFSGSVDGHLRAYSTQDGKVLWDFDTIQDFTTVNAVAGKGGSIDGPRPTMVGGMVFVNSGYGFWGGMPGNVLVGFFTEGKRRSKGKVSEKSRHEIPNFPDSENSSLSRYDFHNAATFHFFSSTVPCFALVSARLQRCADTTPGRVWV